MTGPYVPLSSNPILTQRDLSQGSIRTRSPRPATQSSSKRRQDEWWAVFLGVRPYDAANNFNTGRETFLMPVRWKDGWPRITDPGQVVPWRAAAPKLSPQSRPVNPTNGDFALRDEFDGPGRRLIG